MNRIIRFGFGICISVSLCGASLAQTSAPSDVAEAKSSVVQFENAISQPEISSTLAWNIAAYVPCDRGDRMKAGILKEVTAAEADFDQTMAAMKQLTREEFVCGRIKAYANEAVTLASANPAEARSLFGLEASLDDEVLVADASIGDTPVEKPIISQASVSQVNAVVGGGGIALPTPPRSTTQSTTSDY